MADEKSATLTVGDATIQYSLNEGKLVRLIGKDETRWNAPDAKTVFASAGPSLVVKTTDPDAGSGFSEVWIPSRRLLVEKLVTP